VPTGPAVRFLLNQAALPRCGLAQLIIVAVDRPLSDYYAWIGHQRIGSLPRGRVSIVDCFSDPCGWKAAWTSRQMAKESNQRTAADGGFERLVAGDSGTGGCPAGGNVRVLTAVHGGSNGLQAIVSAVSCLRAQRDASITADRDKACPGKEGGGSERGKSLVLVDSLSSLLLESGIQDVMAMLHSLGALPDTSVASLLHTGPYTRQSRALG
jgi:hypothetical protein